MTPSIGRIVHYVANPANGGGGAAQHWAAIITAVPNAAGSIVDLTAFPPPGYELEPLSIELVVYCEVDDQGLTRDGQEAPPNTWHAPERVV